MTHSAKVMSRREVRNWLSKYILEGKPNELGTFPTCDSKLVQTLYFTVDRSKIWNVFERVVYSHMVNECPEIWIEECRESYNHSKRKGCVLYITNVSENVYDHQLAQHIHDCLGVQPWSVSIRKVRAKSKYKTADAFVVLPPTVLDGKSQLKHVNHTYLDGLQLRVRESRPYKLESDYVHGDDYGCQDDYEDAQPDDVEQKDMSVTVVLPPQNGSDLEKESNDNQDRSRSEPGAPEPVGGELDNDGLESESDSETSNVVVSTPDRVIMRPAHSRSVSPLPGQRTLSPSYSLFNGEDPRVELSLIASRDQVDRAAQFHALCVQIADLEMHLTALKVKKQQMWSLLN
jgi:hypothetical protein